MIWLVNTDAIKPGEWLKVPTCDGVTLYVPLKGVVLSHTGHILRAPGGECEMHIQGDGNFVCYDTRNGRPPDVVRPYWASNTFLPGR